MRDEPARPTERVDERDTMFARAARRPGTTQYDEYYARRPELKAVDDRLRALPELCRPGGRHFDSVICHEADRFFHDIDRIEVDADLVGQWRARLAAASRPTAEIKALARALGAVAVGCTRVGEAFVYTHKGRFDADYGRAIQLRHPSAIVFLVEMDAGAMRHAPQAPVIRESARQYYRAAVVAKTLEAVLVAGGHSATSHYDAHYDVILPPLAVGAGLGEMGRHNLLIADRYGTRVRIAAVTTDFALELDGPVRLGVSRFCDVCRKCAENCPARALSAGGREPVRGVEKWPVRVEPCYAYWRSVGTDCGVCMAACPFSHPDTPFHNLVRGIIRRAPWASRLAVWCDDLVYGRRWRPRNRSKPSRRLPLASSEPAFVVPDELPVCSVRGRKIGRR